MRLQICKDRNTAAGEVHPASSCSSARKRESTVTLRHNRNPIFFSISIIFLFFLFSFFFLRGWGARGLGRLRYLFVCLLFFKFLKVRLRRVENTAIATENPAPNERRVLKVDRSCNCPHRHLRPN